MIYFSLESFLVFTYILFAFFPIFESHVYFYISKYIQETGRSHLVTLKLFEARMYGGLIGVRWTPRDVTQSYTDMRRCVHRVGLSVYL